jgi:hypothetical protein
MQINLSKRVFSREEADFIQEKLAHAFEKGLIVRKTENNSSLKVSYCGAEEGIITPKWNIKIYRYNSKKEGHSVACIDMHILERLLEEDYESFVLPNLPVLRIDDAGWGFPLCGVMVGVSDEEKVLSAIVPVEYFRDDPEVGIQTRRYLEKYTELALQVLAQFKAAPNTHRIEICTGHINQMLRENLRSIGYDVRVVEIKGMLQNRLEELFKEYVAEDIGANIYYDPKAVDKSEIPKRYYECLKYGKKHCPDKIKNGWESIKNGNNRQ